MLRYHMTSLTEDLDALGLGPRRAPARRTEGAPGMPPRPARPARPAPPPAAPPVPAQEDDDELAALGQDDQDMDDQDLPPGQDMEAAGDDQGLDDPGLDLGTDELPPDESLPPEDDEAAPLPDQGGCPCAGQGPQAPMESRRPRRRAPVQRESALSKRVTSLLESSRNILRSMKGDTVMEARRGFQLLANSAHYESRGLARAMKAHKVYQDVRIAEARDALQEISKRCVQVEGALKRGKMTVAEAKPRFDKFFEGFKTLTRVYDSLIEDDETDDKPNVIDPFNKRELPDPEENGLAVESDEAPFDSEDGEEDGEDQMEGDEDEGHEEPDGDEAPFPGAAPPFGKEEGVAPRPFRRQRGR